MPKPHTLPTLYDELKSLSISHFLKNGYLKPDRIVTGIVSWKRGREKTGSISVKTIMDKFAPYLILDYRSNDVPVNYTVKLVSIPSNLGKGVIWYFICPHTHRRCRILHLLDGYFYHRSAFKYCMYETQTYSRNSRWLCRQYGKLFNSEKAYQQIYSKHFKKQYNGNPTKRYMKLLKQAKAREGISEEALLLL